MTSLQARSESTSTLQAPAGDDPLASDTVLLAVLSGAIALLHISAAAGHMSESVLYGVSFVVLAAFQLGWGIAIAFSPRRTALLRAGIAINVGVILIWVCSRTLGLPVGPDLHHPESVGVPDLMATLDEMALIAISTVMLFRPRPRPLPERAVGASCILMVSSLLVFVVLAHIN